MRIKNVLSFRDALDKIQPGLIQTILWCTTITLFVSTAYAVGPNRSVFPNRLQAYKPEHFFSFIPHPSVNNANTNDFGADRWPEMLAGQHRRSSLPDAQFSDDDSSASSENLLNPLDDLSLSSHQTVRTSNVRRRFLPQPLNHFRPGVEDLLSFDEPQLGMYAMVNASGLLRFFQYSPIRPRKFYKPEFQLLKDSFAVMLSRLGPKNIVAVDLDLAVHFKSSGLGVTTGEVNFDFGVSSYDAVRFIHYRDHYDDITRSPSELAIANTVYGQLLVHHGFNRIKMVYVKGINHALHVRAIFSLPEQLYLDAGLPVPELCLGNSNCYDAEDNETSILRHRTHIFDANLPGDDYVRLFGHSGLPPFLNR